MKNKLILLSLCTTIGFAQTFCYDAKNDTLAMEWKKIIQDSSLKSWIEIRVKQQKSDCLNLTDPRVIQNTQEIIDSEPTSVFYFK